MKTNVVGNKSRRFMLPRLSITRLVYLATLALVLALMLTAAVAWVDAGQQANLRFEREIDDGLEGLKSDYDRATRDLAALGNWLVDQKSFIDLVQARDRTGLTQYIEPWTAVSIADSITVSDRNGLVLAQVRSGEPVTEGDTALGLGASALSGKLSSGLGQDTSGRLQGQLILPVYGADKSPLGTLMLGFYVDGSFLQYRSRKLGQEIAFVYNGGLTIITLTDQQGKPWRGAPAPAAVLQAQRESRPSEFLTLETDIGQHLFKFKPLQSPTGATVGMYGIGISLASIDSERWSLFRTVGAGLLLIALGTGCGGFLFARALTSSIGTLDRAAQAMAQGDLSSHINLAHDDELGDLARQLDRMRQQLQEAFQAVTLEKSRSVAVIQSMGVAVIITDHNFNIAAVNPTAQALLREGEANLLGEPWHQIFAVNDASHSGAPFLWNMRASAGAADAGLVLRGRFPLRAHPQVRLDVISTQVQVDGKPAGYVHILVDASAQEQLMRAKDEFILNISHELRGPLAALRASIELLVEDYAQMAKADLGFMLRTMQRAVVKFQGLVENLVDMGNIQAGRFRVYPSPVLPERLIEDALLQVNPLLQGRSQSVAVKIDCPAQFVLADRPRVTQVLINLLTNASKYGPEGESISLAVLGQADFVVIEVTDRGPGIAPEEQAQLFQRFYRGRRAEEEGIGIGLGLALAREIITAHGGQIDVRSKVGEGTTFWFSLPKADQPEESPRIPLAAEVR